MGHDKTGSKHRNVSPDSRRRPLYLRTEDALRTLIGAMEPGSFLPSEPALAKQLGVSRATLREAMRPFEEQGLIVRRQGVGTMVAQAPQVIESGLEVLESVPTLASRINLRVEMGALEVQERPPTAAERELFKIESTTPVVEVSRTLLAAGRPVTYLVDVLPEGILPVDMIRSDFVGSVLDVLLERGEPILHHSRTEISAASASAEIARLLHIQRGDVLLVFEAWLCTARGRAVDHSLSYFLPGTFRFHVLRRVER